MGNDVLITPASRKIEFYDSANNIDAKIETDSSGNLSLTNAGGDINLGDTAADVYIGDGTNSVDIVFEQSGEIRGLTGKTITLGQADSYITVASSLATGSIVSSGNLYINQPSGITNNTLITMRANDIYADQIWVDNSGSIRLRTDNGAFKIFTGGNANSNSAANSVEKIRFDADGDANFFGTYVDIAEYLRHYGDTDTYLRFETDRVKVYAGGRLVFDCDESGSGASTMIKFLDDEFRMYGDGNFHADGNITAYSGTTSSDIRLKKNVKPIVKALESVQALQGISFDWKDETKGKKGQIGFIAQDFEKILPSMVRDVASFKGEETFKTINYSSTVALLVEAIKELKTEVDDLKKQLLENK